MRDRKTRCDSGVGRYSQADIEARLCAKGFSLVGPYAGHTRTEATVQCIHGHQWLARLDNVLKKNGTGCPHCFGRARLTKEVIHARLAAAELTPLCENTYSNRKSKLMCINGHVWETRLDGVLSGGGCPQCSPRRPLSIEEVNERIADRGYVVSGNYVSAGKKVEFECSAGHSWSAIPDNILRGKGCPSCAEYGFNPQYPAQFYMLRIFSCDEDYVGFGITRDVETRMKYHRRAIERQGFSMSDLYIHEFANGQEALKLERFIKGGMHIVDTGIPGFRTEAIFARDVDKLRKIVLEATYAAA